MDGMTEDEKGMEAAVERARNAAMASAPPEGGDAALMMQEAAKAGAEMSAPDAHLPPPAAEEKPSKLTGDETPHAGSDDKVTALPELNIGAGGGDDAPYDRGAIGEDTEKLPELPVVKPEPPAEPWARMQHDLRENSTRAAPPSPIAEKMKAIGWEPKAPQPTQGPAGWADLKAKLSAQPAPAPQPPTPPAPAPPAQASGPDWMALQNQIQAAQRGSDTQRTIAAMLHAAAPGFQPPANIGEGEVAAAKLPIEIQQHRAQYEAAQRKQAEDLLAKTKQQELSDPNSEVSKRAQERYATQFGGDPRLIPAGLKHMSAAEIEKMTGTATTLTGQKNSADIAKSHEQAAKDAKAAAEAAKQADKDKDKAAEAKSLADEVEAVLKDPIAQKLGYTKEDLDGMNRKGLDAVRHRVEVERTHQPKGGAGTGHPAKAVHKIEDISDAGERGKVKQLLDGYLNLNDLPAKGNERSRILSYALQIDPNFDPSRGIIGRDVREKIAKDPSVQAYNTALEHMARARTNIPKNFDTQMLNRIRQAVLTGSGSPEMTKFELDVKAASDEYANALGEKAQAGRQELEHMFSTVQSPQQLTDRLDEVDHLMAGKLHAIQRQYQAYAPKGAELPEVLRGRQDEKKPAGRVKLRKAGTTLESEVSTDAAAKLLQMKNPDGSPKYSEVK